MQTAPQILSLSELSGKVRIVPWEKEKRERERERKGYLKRWGCYLRLLCANLKGKVRPLGFCASKSLTGSCSSRFLKKHSNSGPK